MADAAFTSLMEALEAKDAAKVQTILSENLNIDLEQRDEHHNTPLHVAIEKRDEENVRQLLEAGAKAEAPPRPYGQGTPLIHAIECPGNRVNVKIVSMLLEHGAKPDTFDPECERKKPLLIAAKDGYESIVLMLLAKGADVKQIDEEKLHQYKAVHYAAEEGQAGVLRILAEEGADLNEREWLDRSPLQLAISGNRREAFDTLLDLGADPFATGKTQSTLLMCAASAGETGLLDRLVQMGINVNSQNANGDTALHFATWSGRGACVDKLLQLGADRNIPNKKGQTPRDIAEQEGHLHIVRQIDANSAEAEKIGNAMKTGLNARMTFSKPLRLVPRQG
ncbi:MAG: ankyrin repeat domain-containing protein [Alphaproteobacteria bacterium]|nr:MAG: ankyrin repeat domain-containing protein [Alphaproteobacteria bacterium]